MTTLRVRRDEVASGQAKRLAAGHAAVCLVRIGERFFAIGDRCTHADVSLSEGEVDTVECSIECWRHGSAFSLVDGKPISLPATEAVPVYAVAVEGDDVVVSVR